ncbi:MAG: WD40 repeat domain-containing protein [Candidatus Thorarchaeota archaeon]
MTERLLSLDDLTNDIVISHVEDDSVINALATDGDLLYSVSSTGVLGTWSMGTLRELHAVRIGTESLLCLALDQEYVFIGSSYSTAAIAVWRKDDFSPVISFRDDLSSVLAISDNGREVLAARSGGSVDFYSKSEWAKVVSLPSQQNIATALAVDDEYIYVGGIDDFVTVFKRQDFSHVVNLEGHDADIFCLFSDGDYLLSGSGEVWWGGPGSPRPPSFESAVRIWKKGTWECVRVLEGHEDNVNGIAADDERIYSISDDGTLRSYLKSDWTQTVLPLSSRPLKSVISNNEYLYTCDGAGRIMKVAKSVFKD